MTLPPAPLPFASGDHTPMPRLLIVDDQPINIHAMHQIFAGNYQVFMATSGRQAIEFCRLSPPDLVLMDVMMPDMDGLEACRQLKQMAATRDIPVIFVTTGDKPEHENACWEAGGVDFVAKPVNPLTLRNRVRVHLTLKLQSDRLREMAFVDGLTGVANRRYFDERLAREWRHDARHLQPLSLVMVDVDFFKRYNDQYGHLAGDDCLRRIAGALKLALNRPYDLVARYGGEEFVCLLPATTLDGALNIAQALGQAVATLGLEHAGSELGGHVTISLGVASTVPQHELPPETLIQCADKQLYLAKNSGRARACGTTLSTPANTGP
ncbi:diguanylate cyclase [Duganella vulcania]|uniref:diguanylate cyclase n=1 Tax=Duganella vulcania TaxID=2692166 RepID=A0A845GIC0_9BURK|nr:diguanylate cyclase [Duganella vulcania]MYM92517.1 diguanylate cyclase [Duganella vulcania]